MSQVDKVVMGVRKMILDGDVLPSHTFSESTIARELGVSRTPTRLAFKVLEQEGLIYKDSPRKYRIRSASEKDIQDAIEVRGVLEGLAARLAAEAGLNRASRVILEECLDEMDEALDMDVLDEDAVTRFGRANCRFHSSIVEFSGNQSIKRLLDVNDHMPLASVSSIGFQSDNPDLEKRRFHYGHTQHHLIFQAIVNGQGTRAQMLMHEHAHSADTRLLCFGHDPKQPTQVIHSLDTP